MTLRRRLRDRLYPWGVRALHPDRPVGRAVRRAFLLQFTHRLLMPETFERPAATGDERPLWLGTPAWNLPLDLWVFQEIVSETRPDVIVETGTRYGGSALFLASVCDLLDHGEVVTVDVDTSEVAPRPREHPRITIVTGDSTGDDVVARVRELVGDRRAMVVLDSMHTYAHATAELEALAPFVAQGCYLIVEDTGLGHLYMQVWRELLEGGSRRALDEWLPRHPDFTVDRSREKFLVTLNPGGYVRRSAAPPAER